jgi:hypothetical protein
MYFDKTTIRQDKRGDTSMPLRQLLIALLFAVLGTPCSRANIIVLSNPGDGTVAGEPGQTVGWGFTIVPDPADWATIAVTAISFDTNPALGFFTDNLGPQGGMSNGVLPPGLYQWTQNFDPVNMLGLGGYTISAAAPAGSIDSGTIAVIYELFSQDPNVCPGCYVSTNEIDLPFSVQAVPEPGSYILLLSGLACLGTGRARSRRPVRKT